MSSQVAKDLRTYLLADDTIDGLTDHCFVNIVPETKDRPFIWLRRSGSNGAGVIGQVDDEWQQRFDVECVGADLDAADDLAAAVRSRLAGTVGTMGSNKYAWVAVEDQYDDYEVVNRAGDERIEVVSLVVEVTLP